MFGVKSVWFFKAISAAIQGKNQYGFWKRFELLFEVKLVHVFKEIQASVQSEISPCFGRDSGYCSR